VSERTIDTASPARLTLRCTECGARWTLEVSEEYGPVLDRDTVCEHCCAELELPPPDL
jgi:hypothetical protein